MHIFLSSAYLVSLAVTVLIVYVMNPPVGNAVQGAYVVAVVITGAVLGGLAVVFPEMTEGLGCLLGGFCLSMWCAYCHASEDVSLADTGLSLGPDARWSCYFRLRKAHLDRSVLPRHLCARFP